MCEYEMGPASIVEDKEQNRDGWQGEISIPPFNVEMCVCGGGGGGGGGGD